MIHTVRIPMRETKIGDLGYCLEAVREIGGAEFDPKTASIVATFEIGPDNIPDLWDLRDEMENLADRLDAYGADVSVLKIKPDLGS